MKLTKLTPMLTMPNDHTPFENLSFEIFEHGMREFAIYTNNGYVLQFGQKINITQ